MLLTIVSSAISITKGPLEETSASINDSHSLYNAFPEKDLRAIISPLADLTIRS